MRYRIIYKIEQVIDAEDVQEAIRNVIMEIDPDLLVRFVSVEEVG